METVKVSKNDVKNDLPVADTRANGLLFAAQGPADMVELRAALTKVGGKIKHAGGALPPLFPEKGIREGDARLVTYLGCEIVAEERLGGKNGAAVVLNFEVHDHNKPSLPVAFRAQMWLNATLDTYFGCEKVSELDEKHPAIQALGGAKKVGILSDGDKDFMIPTRDPEKTPMLIVTYAGQGPVKKQGFAPAKRWIIEEFTPKT